MDKASSDSKSSIKPDRSPAILLLSTMGDTTWRMFIPTIGLLLLGDWIDRTYSTRPTFLLIGVVVGTIISTILIRNQLKE